MNTTKRICLWSSPRNVSTAFMYSWAQRKDTVVIDEPLYGFYLNETMVNHPGKDEIIAAMNCNGQQVIDNLIASNFGKEILFIKHMTHHTLNLDLSFMREFDNIFFIRNPKQIIASYAAVIDQPTLNDIGIEMQEGIFNYSKRKGFNTYVLDSGELLKNPKLILTKLCAQLQIPFDENMLHWPAGPKVEDGIWAKYWYDNVHRTTGFDKQPTSERPLPEHLISLYEEAKPIYQNLFKHSLKA
jgi:hypothetical protein